MLTTRDTYTLTRRAYRASRRLSLGAPGAAGDAALAVRLATASALRQVCQHWDTCEPVERPYHSRKFVAAACTRWMRAH